MDKNRVSADLKQRVGLDNIKAICFVSRYVAACLVFTWLVGQKKEKSRILQQQSVQNEILFTSEEAFVSHARSQKTG